MCSKFWIDSHHHANPIRQRLKDSVGIANTVCGCMPYVCNNSGVNAQKHKAPTYDQNSKAADRNFILNKIEKILLSTP
jgi:hypothetical protein